MDYPKEQSKSLYDYSDKSVPQAGYAAIAYGVISLFNGLLALIQYLLYHRPGRGGSLDRDFAAQQWLQHTPLLTAIAVALSVLAAVISGTLAFFIFRRSKVAIVLMLLFVIIPQLYTWFIVHSIAGSLVSIIITAFLARGAVRIFERPEEDRAPTSKS